MASNSAKLYSPWQACGAALIGGPSAGLWLVADNFRNLGLNKKARNLRIVLVAIFLALLAFEVYGPRMRSTTVCSALLAVGVREYAKWSCGTSFEAHLSSGGSCASHWRWIVVGLVGLIVSVVTFFGYVYSIGYIVPELVPSRLFELTNGTT